MWVLDPEQLTGRTRSHVLELPELHCTLHAQAARAFIALRASAAADGFDLAVASSFRDFERQLAIWNDKFHARRPLLDRQGRPMDRARMSAEETVTAILHWSALPGASRHHWGTEIDVFDRSALSAGVTAQLVPAEYGAGGIFARLDAWLAQHAESHGFHRPYDCDRGGVQPEPWHLSYAPVAGAALSALTVEVLAQALRGAPLAGAEVVLPRLADIHRDYVRAVATPGTLALAAPLSPAARPS
jgi:LAS superfamily LD-carboxypeptidase LdcB